MKLLRKYDDGGKVIPGITPGYTIIPGTRFPIHKDAFKKEDKEPTWNEKVGNTLNDAGTKLLHGVSTLGGSVIGDAVKVVSPKAANWLDRNTWGVITTTPEDKLIGNRSSSDNKWLNRGISGIEAVNSALLAGIINKGLEKLTNVSTTYLNKMSNKFWPEAISPDLIIPKTTNSVIKTNVGTRAGQVAIGKANTPRFISLGSSKPKPLISGSPQPKGLLEAPKVDIELNLRDLNEALNFAKKHNYSFPENLDRIAKSDKLTDMSIRGLMDRHNSYARGVSTNWEMIGKKNPETIQFLKNKGFDLNTQQGTKNAAEYMATHIPGETGYGRAGLDNFTKGLYTSNSFPTAEGYTYGDGYMVKIKLPTDYSSKNRVDWIKNNNPKYFKGKLPSDDIYKIPKNQLDDVNFNLKDLVEKGMVDEKTYPMIENYRKQMFDVKKRLKNEYLKGYNDMFDVPDEIWDNYKKMVNEETRKIYDNVFYVKPEHNIFKHVENKGMNFKSFIDDLQYTMDEKDLIDFNRAQLRYKRSLDKSKLTDQENFDFVKQEFPELYKRYSHRINDYKNPNYSHYIHLGEAGEKVADVVSMKRITPDKWTNTSRAHKGKYSHGLTGLSIIPGILGGSTLLNKAGAE